jgi:hypothetical protein
MEEREGVGSGKHEAHKMRKNKDEMHGCQMTAKAKPMGR